MIECECTTWARAYRMDKYSMAADTHHRHCRHRGCEDEAVEALCRLLHGIDCWASDEDGVHPECWDAYRAARGLVGMPVRDDEYDDEWRSEDDYRGAQ